MPGVDPVGLAALASQTRGGVLDFFNTFSGGSLSRMSDINQVSTQLSGTWLPQTIATLSLKSGVDVKTLSGALGHYSAGFTLNTYTHATAQMKQDAADTIGGVISQQMR